MEEVAFELDKNSDRPIYSLVCTFCRHLGSQTSAEAHCAAFLDDTIPDDIWYARNKHQQPYPGDGGIRFEARPEVKPEVLAAYGLGADQR